jgi:restriction system protein
LDALRSSLYRFQAVRGIIITTAGFSKGAMQAAFEAGAPPITLIDGSKLMDLLTESSPLKWTFVTSLGIDPQVATIA